MNFRPAAESVRVDTSGLSCTDLLDLRTAASRACGQTIELTVTPLGYVLLSVR